MRARTLRPWFAASFVLALLVGGAPAAGALPFAPEGPSDQDVRDARAAYDAVRGSVAAIEVRLAQLAIEADDVWLAVERAAEDYTQTLVDRDAASAEARSAAARLEAAESELEVARQRLVAIALRSMRTGSSGDQVRAVLESGGVAELVETSEALEMLGARTNEVVQDFRAATLVAETLRGRAQAALEAQEAAVVASQEALATAEALQKEAEERVASAELEREDLLERLAAARETSVQVERERQQRLDAERRERERTQRERREREDRDRSDRDRTDTRQDRDRDRTRDRDDRDRGDARDERPDRGEGGSRDEAPGRDEGGRDQSPPPSNPSPDPTPDPKPSPKPKDPEPPAKDPYGLGTGTSVGSASKGKAAVEWAKKQLGVEYVYGGTGNPGFDCSGLTMRAWASAGVSLNRSSRDQYRQVRKIERSQVRPGDLLFWGDGWRENDPSKVTHVAMYIGDNKIIEAPRPGLQVRIVELDGWRMDRIMPFAGRP